MYHHPSRAAKTGRVVARDGANFGLHYSLQAQATLVNERPTSKQQMPGTDCRHHGQESGAVQRPISNPSLGTSAKYRHTISPSPDGEHFPVGERPPSVLQYSHSSTDATQDAKYQFATPSFRELNKVQRQVLHPTASSVTDHSSVQAGTTVNQSHESPGEECQGGGAGRQLLSAGSQVKSKGQVFLPGSANDFASSEPREVTSTYEEWYYSNIITPSCLYKALLHIRTLRDFVSCIDERDVLSIVEMQGNYLKPVSFVMPGPGRILSDRVIFAESPSAPGVPIVYRLPEERHSNPDRLNLDRRRLSVCPILEGEDNLRLLNFQHNLINRIQHLGNLKRLIFLDFYDNQIEEISGLNSLKSLRVLMLGKNRLRKINNLEALVKLDVLDLHGNKITKIENLNHLTELRVLNLAGNEIVNVSNISGMKALAELNLRRNRICTVEEVENLPNIQRIFLSFNSITSFDDISSLSGSLSLSELSLDGNPFASDVTYKQTVLKYVSTVRQLDMKRISEEERRIAMVMGRKEDEKRKETTKLTVLKDSRIQPGLLTKKQIQEKRRVAINNAQRQWEKSRNILENDSSVEPHASDSSVAVSRGSASGGTSILNEMVEAKIPSTALSICHLAELDSETLHLYGPGSLDALDRNWGSQAVSAVCTLSFKFIDFDNIVPHFLKISARFPSLTGLSFTETNIHSFQQINALSSLRKLDSLSILPDGNLIIKFTLWKPYTLFRLAHFNIQRINDVEVMASDIVNAEKLFGTLAHITTSQLPQSRLLTLLGSSRRKQNAEADKTKKIETKQERTSSNESVGRAGLQYWPVDIQSSHYQEEEFKRNFSKNYIKEIAYSSAMVDRKKKKLDEIWPSIFGEMVQKALYDMRDLDSLMKNSLEIIRLKK